MERDASRSSVMPLPTRSDSPSKPFALRISLIWALAASLSGSILTVISAPLRKRGAKRESLVTGRGWNRCQIMVLVVPKAPLEMTNRRSIASAVEKMWGLSPTGFMHWRAGLGHWLAGRTANGMVGDTLSVPRTSAVVSQIGSICAQSPNIQLSGGEGLVYRVQLSITVRWSTGEECISRY